MLENVPQKHKKVNLVDDVAQISTKNLTILKVVVKNL